MEQVGVEPRRAFGLLFVCVSISVASGAILSEIAYLNNLPLHFYALIWIASFGAVFGSAAPKLRKIGPTIKDRMKGGARWPIGLKALNAICWAGPFLSIPFFPAFYQYLILLGIGLGNMSTFLLIKKYSGKSNAEQLIVASVSLASLPVAFAIDMTILATHQDIAVMLSRILIAASYGAGGIFALSGKR